MEAWFNWVGLEVGGACGEARLGWGAGEGLSGAGGGVAFCRGCGLGWGLGARGLMWVGLRWVWLVGGGGEDGEGLNGAGGGVDLGGVVYTGVGLELGGAGAGGA